MNIATYLKATTSWIYSFLFPKKPELPMEPQARKLDTDASIEDFAPVVATTKRRTKREIESERKNFGAFYYFDGILDSLDNYMSSIKLLKKHDPDTYALYSRIGGRIIGQEKPLYEVDRLNSYWVVGGNRPAIGMCHVYFNRHDDDNRGHPDTIYFTKTDKRSCIQVPPPGSDVYEVNVFWKDKNYSGRTALKYYYVAVTKEGDIKVLRELHIAGGHYPVRQWSVNSFLKEFASEKNSDGSARDPDEAGRGIFAICANMVVNAAGGVQVRATKAGITSVFDVEMKRTPYFFKDRNKTVNAKGTTARIFHYTRPHKRVTASGKEIFVKSHFRGLRRFEWNGYEVVVTMPGLHHNPLVELDATTMEKDDDYKQHPGAINMATAGNMISKAMSGEARL